jgi:hypothetical protein
LCPMATSWTNRRTDLTGTARAGSNGRVPKARGAPWQGGISGEGRRWRVGVRSSYQLSRSPPKSVALPGFCLTPKPRRGTIPLIRGATAPLG